MPILLDKRTKIICQGLSASPVALHHENTIACSMKMVGDVARLKESQEATYINFSTVATMPPVEGA